MDRFRFSLVLFVVGFCGYIARGEKHKNECNVKELLQIDPHTEIEEKARNIQAEWMAKDALLVVASSPTTNVWLGSKQPTGLFRFTKHKGTIDDEVDPGSLTVSPAGWETAIMKTTDSNKLYVSSDSGASWTKCSIPGGSGMDIQLSKIHPSHVVVLNDAGELYMSFDLGANWKKIASRVALVTLVKQSGDTEYLFYSAKESNSPVFNLYRVSMTASSSNEPKVICSDMYRYYVDDKYLFVSKENYTTFGGLLFSKTRRFYVSTNYFSPKPTFTQVQLPAAKWNHHVQVMATHETGAFIHISLTDDNKGTLYVSDSSGVRFTVSLHNHLFKRIAIFSSMVNFNDFYEVDSIRGVYITVNVTTHNKTDYHSSVITFDNGASWQLLNPPKTADCSLSAGCSLHLHATYSTIQSYILSNVTLKSGPFSASNAPGIIIAHASIGQSRDYDPTKAVIVTSQDGGHTWTKPDIPPGQYTYGIADYGNVIAVVPDSENAQYIWFSHDRGVCFRKQVLDSTQHFKISKGLLMDPKTTSLYAVALGLEGNEEEDYWKLIAIYFGSVLSSPCHDSDYMTTDLGISCVLGHKHVYTIVKPESVCHTDDGYSPLPKDTSCNCTYHDMECEFGYTPSWSNGVLNCTLSDKNGDTLAKECPPGDKYYYQSKTGLRIIAGDKCKNTTETAKLLAYERKKCVGHEKESGIDENKTDDSHTNRTAAQVIGAIIIIIALMAAAGLTLYCVIKCRKPTEFHDRVLYKKIPLTENGFSDNSDSDEDLLN